MDVIKCNRVLFLVILYIIGCVVAPPVDPKKANAGKEADPQGGPDLELEYWRYLQQVIQVLEQDKEFAKKLENVSAADIKSGDVAHELEFVNHGVRTKLDELKRMELERLRNLIRLQQQDLGVFRNDDGRLNPPPGDVRQWRTLSMGDGPPGGKFKLPYHLDLKNPSTFEIDDLKKLIKAASQDLDELNEKRKEEFKRYEMEKEHKRKEELKTMNDSERKAAELKHQEMVDKHKDHPQVHHPGSKQQLEQVWEEVDHLPRDEFDPKTFFRMHDINGDGFLDEEEVKALVALEVRKMYNISNVEDDPVEMQEEFSRMEEHIFKEADKNHDRLISLEEFIDMTKKPDFEQDPGWKGLDEEQIYSPEELMEYERQLAMQGGYYPNMPNQHGYPQDPQGGYHPGQQYDYQPVHGGPPNNQGVQFHPLPDHQGQQAPMHQQPNGQMQGSQQHPSAPQQQYPPGQVVNQPHPGQPMGQPSNSRQPQQQQYGGQPVVGGGNPPHYPPQYAQPGGPQFGGPPPFAGQPPMGGVPPPHHQGIPPNVPVPQQVMPAQPAAPSGQAHVQPQVPSSQGTAPK